MTGTMKSFTRGLLRENPIFVLVVGLCPALAVTNRVVYALGMAAAVLVALACANLFASAFREKLPKNARLPLYTLATAVVVTVEDLLMQAYTPGLYDGLGIYAKLIVVNCLILGRVDTFASRNPVGRSLVDALGMGLGFAVGLTFIAVIREVLGSGTITLFPVGDFSGTLTVPLLSQSPIRIVGLAAGALLVFGYLKAVFNWYRIRDRERATAGGATAAPPAATKRGERPSAGQEV